MPDNKDPKTNVIPFGKYKGQPMEALALLISVSCCVVKSTHETVRRYSKPR